MKNLALFVLLSLVLMSASAKADSFTINFVTSPAEWGTTPPDWLWLATFETSPSFNIGNVQMDLYRGSTLMASATSPMVDASGAGYTGFGSGAALSFFRAPDSVFDFGTLNFGTYVPPVATLSADDWDYVLGGCPDCRIAVTALTGEFQAHDYRLQAEHSNSSSDFFNGGGWVGPDDPNGGGAVPEPASLILLGTGLLGGSRALKRK